MAKRNYEIIETSTGRLIENDDDDVLRPGQTLRVPMMFRDGMSPMQRSVVDAKMARDVAKRFGLNDALDLHKPGQRFCTDQAARARVEQARAEWIDEMTTAWQRQPDAAPPAGAINGADGRLVRRGDLPMCEPVRQDAMDARERAYREMFDDLQNAWRQPVAAPPSVEPRATTDVPRTMTADAAQRIKDAAWLQSVKDLESAWKGPAR